MAKPPPVSYGGLSLAKNVPKQSDEVVERAESEGQAARPRPMESKAEPTLIYLHPEGKTTLKRWAIEQGLRVKVHDLLIEALEEWADKRGLETTFRVPTERKRRTS